MGKSKKIVDLKSLQLYDDSEKICKVRIYSDGSSKGKTDCAGGYGTIVQYLDEDGRISKTIEYAEGFKVTTNNRMELMGAIVGLESLTEPCEVEVYSDSQYLVKAFNDKWIDNWIVKGWKTSEDKTVKNDDLWKRLLKAKEPHNVSWFWVKGHNGHHENERCDFLAQTSSQGQKYRRNENGILQPIDDVSDVDWKKITINDCEFIYKEKTLACHPNEDPVKAKHALDKIEDLLKVLRIRVVWE